MAFAILYYYFNPVMQINNVVAVIAVVVVVILHIPESYCHTTQKNSTEYAKLWSSVNCFHGIY